MNEVSIISTNFYKFLIGIAFVVLFFGLAGRVEAADCATAASGNWSSAATWYNCGDTTPTAWDTVTVTSTVTIDVDATTTDITINSGGVLQFQTSGAGVTLTVNDDDGAVLLTVGAAATAGTLTCRAPASDVNTIKLNSTSSDAAVGIQVESMGKLDIQGTSATDQDCLITNGGTTLDGTRDGYIYLKNGSETIIKYAEISYLGTNAANKYGITVDYGVDGSVANAGFWLEGSNIHHSYYAVNCLGNYNQIISNSFSNISSTNYALVMIGSKNLFYKNKIDGGLLRFTGYGTGNLITSNEFYNGGAIRFYSEYTHYNTVINNIIRGGDISFSSYSEADNNMIYNNTIDGATTGISIANSNCANNIFKNNIITNCTTGISDSGTGTVIDYNYYYNNATDCSGTCSPNTLVTGSGNNPSFVSTSTSNADFMYVNSTTTSNGPLGVGIELWGTGAGTVPGYINVGARLDFVKNITDSEKFNWLQQAHDDSNLGAGDTVTTYAKNYFSDTITATSTTGNYYFKFNINSTGNITANNDYEGTYLYFTSGINKGKYYLIIDSTNASPDTVTIYSPSDAVTTFFPGDGFTVVDRVYTKDSGQNTSCDGTGSGNQNLCLDVAGTAASPITWNTSGRVVIDAQNLRNDGVLFYRSCDYNIFDGFDIQNAVDDGITFSYAEDYMVVQNNIIHKNGDNGIYFDNTNLRYSVVRNNTIFNNSDDGIDIYGSGPTLFKANVIYSNGSRGIYGYNNPSFFFMDNTIFGHSGTGDYGIYFYRGLTDNNTVVNNILLKNNYGLYLQGDSYGGGDGIVGSNKIFNNVAVANTNDGIILTASGYVQNNTLYNNISAYNGDDGLDDDCTDYTANTYNFNNLYGNSGSNYETSDVTPPTPPSLGGANSTSSDPQFYWEVATTTAADNGGTTQVLYDASQSWTENQWVGAGVYISGASCPAGNGVWAGVTSNTASRLFLAPTLSGVVNANCNYGITRFYLSKNSPALAAGTNVISGFQPSPAQINIGARTGYIVNGSDKFNFLQQAEDDSGYGAGDTLNVYGYAYGSGTISAITDMGPYASTSLSVSPLTDDNQFEGMYMLMTSGTNHGKTYLIIDSTSTDPGIDHMYILIDSTTGFSNGDTFKIVDRIYEHQGDTTNSANLNLSLSGTVSSPITWDAVGSPIISADTDTDNTAELSYNIYGNSGVEFVKIDKDFIFATGTTAALGGTYNADDPNYYIYGSFSENGTFTLEGWVRPTNSITSKALFVKDTEYRMMTDASNKLACQICGIDGWQTGATSTAALTLNQWNYVSCTYDRSNVKVYVNGVLQATQSMSNIDVHNATTSLMLGEDESDAYADYQGYIDEFKFFKYARSASQVKADYTGKQTPRGATTRSVTVGEQRDASEGLVAYWKMDETYWSTSTGDTAVVLDSSGNGNHGTPYAEATSTATAKFGRAGTFDGTGDYVNIADNAILRPESNNWTISAWAKPPDSNQQTMIISKREASGDYDQIYLAICGNIGCDSAGQKLTAAYRSTGDIERRALSSADVADGNWHHYVMVADSSANKIKLYLDGVELTTSLITDGVWPTVDNTQPLQIGAGNGYFYFNGQIDDVKIYKVARTAEQIRKDYESGPPPVAHWKMDENTGQYAYDTTGNSNTGTLGTGATADSADPQWTAGKYGSSLQFDGSDDYVGITDSNSLDVEQITISMWLKPQVGSINQYLVAKSEDIGNQDSYRLYLNTANALNLVIYDAGGGSTETANTSVTLNTWSFITVSYSFGSYKMYINGMPVPIAGGGSATGAIIQGTGRFTIGSRYDASEGGYVLPFNGLIDDVRIYNYARTPKQILEDMLAGHPLIGAGSNPTAASGSGRVAAAVGYWSFDEGYGTTAYDKSVHKNNLTLSTESWENNCKFSGCWDGQGSYRLSRSDDSDFDFASSTEFSISMWFKSDNAGNPSATEYLLSKESSSAGYAIYAETDGDIVFGTDDDTSWGPDDSAGNISKDFYDATWHHLVAVKLATTTTSRLEMYIDGILRSSDTSIAGQGNLDNSDSLTIGDRDSTNNGDEFNGDIDEVSIYRFALSPAEIKELYNRSTSFKLGALAGGQGGATSSDSASMSYCVPGDTSPCTPPVLHIKMDEKTGQYAYDTSGNGNNGTLGTGATADASDPTWKSAASCHTGSCLSFDGGDDYAWCANRASLSITGPLTLEAWIKPFSLTGTHFIVNKRSGAPSGYSFAIVSSSGYKLQLVTEGLSDNTIQSLTNLQTNTWYYVVGVYDGSQKYIYINGVLDNSESATGSIPTSEYLLRIGCGPDSPFYYFNGLIDDVRIYNYARTPAQIAWDYNRGKPIALWKMDEGQDTATTCNATTASVRDSSGNNFTGTIYGATSTLATSWSEAKFNCGLDFDGTDDYVKVGNTSRYDIRTLSFWLKPDSTTQNIISLSATNTVAISSGVVSATGFGTETVYVDGKQTTSFPDTNWHIVSVVSDSDIQATEVLLGRVGSNYYSGLLDDVRIYNYALTAQQIKMLYNEGAAVRFGPTEGLP